MDDVFGTAGLRERVLAAWRATPARFREDANAEEDLALGGYRDRLVVELAQNAADAAGRAAGVPGRVRFTIRETDTDTDTGSPTLVVANTGAPLTADGVESLATLRASAKRDGDSVGRFGVGFAAVLAVTDEPIVVSGQGGVRFSKDDTAALVAGEPALTEEVRRRDGQVPVLRLPFAAEGEPPDGYDTAVLLPLRDEAAADLVRQLLAEADDALLLALPGLERIEIDLDGAERVLEGAAARWHVVRADGELTGDVRERLLKDRPTEERARPYWSVLWALPRDPETTIPDTVHAPTPTDEPLSLPALLLASFPLDPTRRHVATGPLTDRLVEEAAEGYANLLRQRAEDGADVLPLVPTGLAAGALDARLREQILTVLPGTPMLRPVDPDGTLLRPRDAVAVDDADPALDAVLAPIVDGLVATRRQDRAALDALGVRRVDLAEVVDQLAATTREPSWWREVYAAVAALVADPLSRETLGTLPVPLADGRLVRGARGLVLAGDDLPAEALSAFASYGLRVVHPDAAHETLERLGARRTSPRALLADGAVRAAIEAEPDDPDALAEAVLTLVAADTGQPERPWWLGELALRDADGELVPANALVVAGSDAEAVLEPEEVAPVARELVERYGVPALESVGVLRTLRAVSVPDVALDALPDALADVDDLGGWVAEHAPAGSVAGELTVVRDLDWVIDWPRALALLGSDPVLRAALVRPVRVVDADGQSREAPSYPSWWVRRHVRLDDDRPLAGRADPDADPALAGLLDPAPEWLVGLDPEVRTATGLVREIADLDAGGVELLLGRLVGPDSDLDDQALVGIWAALGAGAAYPGEPPARVRVLGGRVVDADRAVVADAPMWLQRTDLGGFVVATGPAADGLSDLLDLPLAPDVAAGAVDGDGTPAPVPDVVRRLLPGVPETWWEHDELTVDGHEVAWWVDPEGRPHAATGDGLAKALAWSAGRWAQRHLVLAALAEPERAVELLVESAYDAS